MLSDRACLGFLTRAMKANSQIAFYLQAGIRILNNSRDGALPAHPVPKHVDMCVDS